MNSHVLMYVYTHNKFKLRVCIDLTYSFFLIIKLVLKNILSIFAPRKRLESSRSIEFEK